MPKITVYTINNCPFCAQEKAYLNEHKFLFEEKNIDVNHAYLSEMLTVSDNFTGVPFTLIQKDDGSKVPLKGFTKEEFDSALGVSAVPAQDTTLTQQPVSAQPVSEQVSTTQTTQPEVAVPPIVETPIQSAVQSAPITSGSDEPHKETFMHIPNPSLDSQSSPQQVSVPTQPATFPAQSEPTQTQSGSTQDNSHDQKLQDILSNLQKISGMGDQSSPIQSVSSDVVPPSVPPVATPPPTTAVPESVVPPAPIEAPTQAQSAPAPFMQPHADPTVTQSDVSPTLPTGNPSVVPTETPTTQIPTIPDFPKQ